MSRYRFTGVLPRTGSRALRWLRIWLAVRLAVPRGASAALVQDRVRAYLIQNLATYNALGPPGLLLPFVVGVDHEANVRRDPDPAFACAERLSVLADMERSDSSIRLVELRCVAEVSLSEAAQLQREVEQHEKDLASVEADAGPARAAVSRRKSDLTASVAAGDALPNGVRPLPRARLSPVLPALWTAVFAVIGVVALVVAGSWQFARPYLDGSLGVDPAALGREWLRDPGGILTAFLWSAGVAGGLLAAAHIVVDAAMSVRSGAGRRHLLLAAAAAAPCALLVAISLSLLSRMRHASSDAVAALSNAVGGGNGAGISTATFVVANLSELLVGGLLSHFALQRMRGRREAVAEARRRKGEAANDHARRSQVRARHEDLIAAAESRNDAVERRRSQLRAAIKAISTRAQTVERTLRTEHEARRAIATAFVASLVATLETDRYVFLTLARRRQRDPLEAEAPRVQVALGSDRTGALPAVSRAIRTGTDPASVNGRSSELLRSQEV